MLPELLPYVHALCAPVASELPRNICPTINSTTPGAGNLTESTNSTVVGGVTPTPSVFTGGAEKMQVGVVGLVGVMGLEVLGWL